MAKARVGLYQVKGETLGRTHKSCPKCGPGIFLAEHDNRRSCGRCGYSESKTPTPRVEKPKVEKPKVEKPKMEKPKVEKPKVPAPKPPG